MSRRVGSAANIALIPATSISATVVASVGEPAEVRAPACVCLPADPEDNR